MSLHTRSVDHGSCGVTPRPIARSQTPVVEIPGSAEVERVFEAGLETMPSNPEQRQVVCLNAPVWAEDGSDLLQGRNQRSRVLSIFGISMIISPDENLRSYTGSCKCWPLGSTVFAGLRPFRRGRDRQDLLPQLEANRPGVPCCL